jgi:hypothetical protein
MELAVCSYYYHYHYYYYYYLGLMFAINLLTKRLRWSRGSVLAFGTQVRGFKPG